MNTFGSKFFDFHAWLKKCHFGNFSEFSKILFILGSYNFLAYLECIRSYAWSKGHSDPDLSSVNEICTYLQIIRRKKCSNLKPIPKRYLVLSHIKCKLWIRVWYIWEFTSSSSSEDTDSAEVAGVRMGLGFKGSLISEGIFDPSTQGQLQEWTEHSHTDL